MNDSPLDRRPPEEAFALLGNELRLRIVRALSEADQPLTFTALRERVEERDSGRFNYHLGKLDGWFVSRCEEGYQLTYAGRQVVGAVISGAYNGAVRFDPITLDDPCPECGDRQLEVSNESELIVISCHRCENWRLQFPFPPGTVSQFDREELPTALSRWLRLTVDRLFAGFCENCGGRIDGRYEDLEEEDDPVLLVYECPRCHYEAQVTADQPLIAHRVGSAFFADHGYEPEATPFWQLHAAIEGRSIEVGDASDGRKVTVTLQIDDELLTATIGPDLTFESIERRTA